ncbi:MAG: hypothetical protein HYW10_06325 [Candidatus Omnitrophica bacterium]|nr:hypothetical protein [Candidatus Omnitrophota bacterium]
MTVQPLVALDIGSTKVACAIGLPHEQGSGFELLGTSVVPYRVLSDAWLGDPLMVAQAIEQALEETMVPQDVHRAVVAVTHPALRSERIRVAIDLGDEPMPVRAQDLERLETRALNHVLGVDRDPLVIERIGCAGNGVEGVRDPRGLSATRLIGTFHIVTLPTSARRALVQAVESAGLDVARLTYTLPAAWAGAPDEARMGKLGLLIDVGGLTTDVGLFLENVLQDSRTMPWGGLTLSMAIAKELHVTMDQAMALGLEGATCRKADVRALIERHWGSAQETLEALLADQPRPDVLLVSGRGSLMDGFVEWLEQTTRIPTSLCRSQQVNTLRDLSQQLALSSAIGLLEQATHIARGFTSRSPRLFNRLIDRTRTILTEYF